VTVIEGLPYRVFVAEDAAPMVAQLAAQTGGAVALVFDRRVAHRAAPVREALQGSGVQVAGELAVNAGERRKTLRGAMNVVQWLTSIWADRRSLLIAVGGGTLTDCAGFAAAMYMRGIAWLPVPTTVLGMVDAAIGGKTGVDLPEGKNLVGAFWDPAAVVCDLAALRTLPRKQRATGMAEIIKAGIVGDPALFESVERRGTRALGAHSIEAAARVKVAIVAQDPREHGPRAALNLGHTIGHALEAASGFRMAHGDAVSVGLRAAGLLALAEGVWSRAEHARVLRSLVKCKLPVHHSESVEAVVAALAHDKKRVGSELRFVLPTRVGEVRTEVGVALARAREAVERCAASPGPDELAQ
jgi:3-dehydroquinate synthase